MGIFSALAMAMGLLIPTALWEGSVALYYKIKDAREWRSIRKVFYPKVRWYNQW